jgi:predicted O-methyltransferase YrrM
MPHAQAFVVVHVRPLFPPQPCGSYDRMSLKALLRSKVKESRRRGASWVRLIDYARLLGSAEGQARVWTRLVHRRAVHQTTPQTAEERYPALFNLAASLRPDAKRILSFGCSTGEELVSLRRRFPWAEIVGAEINPRSRVIARRRVASDTMISVIAPKAISGSFDLIFALAVLQREPHRIEEMEVEDLSPYYPFDLFDGVVRELTARLRSGGLLCVDNAHYRVEDSSVGADLEAVGGAPRMMGLLFGRDGLRLKDALARTIFRRP